MIYGQYVSTGASGGGQSCSAVYLPKSTLYNAPATAWNLDTSFHFPSSATANNIQLVKGDKIYLIDYGQIYVGSLTTKLWEAESIPTGYYQPLSACWYDDYKIFILASNASNLYSGMVLLSFNTTDNRLVYLNTIANPGSYQTLQTNTIRLPLNNLPSIWYPEKRRIYFAYARGTAARNNSNIYDSYYMNNGTYYSTSTYGYYRIYYYDVDTNVVTTLWEYNHVAGQANQLDSTYVSWANTINDYSDRFHNSIMSYDIDRQYIYITSGTKEYSINIATNEIIYTPNAGTLPYIPTAWVDFNEYETEQLTFTNSIITRYNPSTHTQTAISLPEAIPAPVFASVNIYNQQIIYMTADTLYSLPYGSAVNLDILAPAWTIFEGQEYSGLSELVVLDSATEGQTEKCRITKDWQVAEENIDIMVGEYENISEYRLLIRNV